MDLEFIIYLLVFLLPLIGRLFGNKKNKRPTRKPPSQTDQAPEERRPTSFQEILRELSGEYQETERKAEERLEEIEEKIQPDTIADEKSRKVYEEAQVGKYKTIDEQVSLEKVQPRGIQTTSEEESGSAARSLAEEIFDDFQSSDQVRKAIIYKEILDRKHF